MESCSISIPVIDVRPLLKEPHHHHLRSQTIVELGLACKNLGIFQVMNHGIVTDDDVIGVASEFFDLPEEEKTKVASSSVYEAVRYGSSHSFASESVKYRRHFIKHYSHPLSTWIHFWPSNPPTYKEKMGVYAKAVHLLHKKLLQAIFETLNLAPDYSNNEIEEGCQVMAVNCYPPCPEPALSLGLPPHSDHGTLTVLLQNQPGLEMMDRNDQKWHPVPVLEGALVVQVGDQMEVMSNGRYKAVVHRAVLGGSSTRRVSIASIHSLALEEKVRPAMEIVAEDDQVVRYRDGSFREFLDFISGKVQRDLTKERYIDTLKLSPSA